MLKTGASANAPVFLCPKKGKPSANELPTHYAYDECDKSYERDAHWNMYY
ncbi:hypothetical protein AB6E04_10190 [Vibrio amylolyticus]